MKGKISEIFESIQGEGIYFGERQIFVRFFGCNLRCSFCDTRLANFEEYQPQSFLDRIKSFRGRFHSISFTGGEPLTQKDFLKICLRLAKAEGHRTYLETNGTLPDALSEALDDLDIIAMDIKLPSSVSEGGSYWEEHIKFLKIASTKEMFIKTVISHSTTKDDFLFMLELLKAHNYCGVLVLQPNSLDGDTPRLNLKLNEFKELALGYLMPSCIIPQMHKIIRVR